MLPRCDTCDWLAQFQEVWRRLTVQAVEHHNAQFVHDLLRNIQPTYLGMEESTESCRWPPVSFLAYILCSESTNLNHFISYLMR